MPIPIETTQELRDHLELAIHIELSTIPPYLFAMYSIEDQDSEPALLIRSIVAEEMLHAALVANLLLAVGGRPRFDIPEAVPAYPGFLPHHKPPLALNLAPCSHALIRDVFMRIEQPEVHSAPDQPDEFETLGQFYHALENGLTRLSETHNVFANPQIEHQLSNPGFYAPVRYDAEDSGGLSQIDDIDSALAAIEIIVHQGEGLSSERWADPSHQELTHYHKLLRIVDGISPLGAVRNLQPDPRTLDYPLTLQPVSHLFNACYRYVFYVLEGLFKPDDDKSGAVGRLYMVMKGVLSTLARFLVSQPLGDGRFAAPTFELFDFGSLDPEEELTRLGDLVGQEHEELAGLAATIATLGR